MAAAARPGQQALQVGLLSLVVCSGQAFEAYGRPVEGSEEPPRHAERARSEDDDWAHVEPYVPSPAEREASARRRAKAQSWAAIVAGVGSLIAALLIVAIVLLGGVEAGGETYSVQSAAMEPTYEQGAEVAIDSSAYEEAEPEAGDVVVYNPPRGAGTGEPVCGVEAPPRSPCPEPVEAADDDAEFLARVVAVPGEHVAIRAGLPVVDGEALFADEMLPCRDEAGCDLPEPITVPDDHYFLLGSNSANSNDSRYFGPVPSDEIFARATE